MSCWVAFTCPMPSRRSPLAAHDVARQAAFEWVLEYLRELRYMSADDDRAGVDSLPLPSDTLTLLQLRRECDFYGLPELHSLVESRLRPQSGD